MHVGIEGFILALNGVICFDMRSQNDRKRVIPAVVERLRMGDSILCSMEAAWNISPNELVYELFYGMLSAALKINAVIIPVGIERFSRNLWGVNAYEGYFDPAKYFEHSSTIDEALQKARYDLRQIMADLKFSLYFHPEIFPKIQVKRNELGDYYLYKSRFQKDILDEYFSVNDIEEKRYHSTY